VLLNSPDAHALGDRITHRLPRLHTHADANAIAYCFAEPDRQSDPYILHALYSNGHSNGHSHGDRHSVIYANGVLQLHHTDADHDSHADARPVRP